MSDSEHSTVTYTSVSIPVEDDSDIGSPGINGPPIMPEDLYAYIMTAYQVHHRLTTYLALRFHHRWTTYLAPRSRSLLPHWTLFLSRCTLNSPGYVPESDPEEELEEDDEDLEEDPADYPADKDDDDDDDEDEDEDEEEEEEHPAPTDSVPPVHRMTARISIRDLPSISLPPREEVERLLALTTPPLLPLTPLSSPLPQIPSPPLPIPSPPPNSPTHIEIPESCLPLGEDRPTTIASGRPFSIAWRTFMDLSIWLMSLLDCFSPTSRELDYGITDTWDDLVGAIAEIAPTTLEGVNQRVTDLATIFDRNTSIWLVMHGGYPWIYDYARSDDMSLTTTVVAQRALISEYSQQITGDRMCNSEFVGIRP
ncbi:hypothetical protein Tco_0838621 [Tanacetum coccineum]|uniref:Uncharacterized protein n=1 Tax=Tanacetum coccineum TaxID=301880 RepID=A0ABQ5AQ38_9ASTR